MSFPEGGVSLTRTAEMERGMGGGECMFCTQVVGYMPVYVSCFEKLKCASGVTVAFSYIVEVLKILNSMW